MKAYKDKKVVKEVLDAFKENKLYLKQISQFSRVPYHIVKNWHKKNKT